MTLTELRSSLKIARDVYVSCIYSDDDVAYFYISKQSVKEVFAGYPRNSEINAVLRNDGDLYIG